ncbi:PREDICTED: uncharacterized protein LOC102016611 [Chinchilla lanigera]|uniref:uncharacterized protein LOC102016611 n=1 Tax=Chinchilla lanigera TaxID=34839 RepID=UPI00038EE61D|nr:PREDICTED: uncharacterized protein LOC102016611 [Chinchilla lanigera]
MGRCDHGQPLVYTRDTARRRRRPPGARAGRPESSLDLPLGSLPFPVCKRRPEMCPQKRSSFPGPVLLEISVLGSPAGPRRPTRDSQRRASRGRAVSAHRSLRARRLPASDLAIQADGADTRAALRDESWPGVGGERATADGREGRAVQRRAHQAGRAARGAFNTMDRARGRPALLALRLVPRASRCALGRLLPGESTRPPPDPLPPHSMWLPTARERAVQVQRKRCGQGGKPGSLLLQRPAPFSCHLSPALSRPVCSAQPGSVALRLHHFLRCPPGCRDAGSLGNSAQRIGSGPRSRAIWLPARDDRRAFLKINRTISRARNVSALFSDQASQWCLGGGFRLCRTSDLARMGLGRASCVPPPHLPRSQEAAPQRREPPSRLQYWDAHSNGHPALSPSLPSRGFALPHEELPWRQCQAPGAAPRGP